MDKTVCVFQKNKFQEVRVGIREFKGNDRVDIQPQKVYLLIFTF